MRLPVQSLWNVKASFIAIITDAMGTIRNKSIQRNKAFKHSSIQTFNRTIGIERLKSIQELLEFPSQ